MILSLPSQQNRSSIANGKLGGQMIQEDGVKGHGQFNQESRPILPIKTPLDKPDQQAEVLTGGRTSLRVHIKLTSILRAWPIVTLALL